MVKEVDGKHLSLSVHGRGGSVWASMDMMEVGDKCLHSNRYGRGGW